MTDPTGDAAPVPAPFAALARKRELGAVLGWQHEWTNGENIAMLVIGLVLMPLAFWWGPMAFGAILGGRVGIHLGGYVVFPKIIGAVPLLVMLLPVLMAGFGVWRLFVGARTTGAFEHGLLQTDRQDTVVIRWPEIDHMLVWSRNGKPTEYAIVGTGGLRIKFRHDQRQRPHEVTLGEQVAAAVRHLGRPIQPAGARD
jgi:hypothetical protein